MPNNWKRARGRIGTLLPTRKPIGPSSPRRTKGRFDGALVAVGRYQHGPDLPVQTRSDGVQPARPGAGCAGRRPDQRQGEEGGRPAGGGPDEGVAAAVGASAAFAAAEGEGNGGPRRGGGSGLPRWWKQFLLWWQQSRIFGGPEGAGVPLPHRLRQPGEKATVAPCPSKDGIHVRRVVGRGPRQEDRLRRRGERE